MRDPSSGGKPTPDLIATTARNLREISPTLYFNVPRGYDLLLPRLESDEALGRSFFSSLDAMFYAGAALPQNLYDRLSALIPPFSTVGSTSARSGATFVAVAKSFDKGYTTSWRVRFVSNPIELVEYALVGAK